MGLRARITSVSEPGWTGFGHQLESIDYIIHPDLQTDTRHVGSITPGNDYACGSELIDDPGELADDVITIMRGPGQAFRIPELDRLPPWAAADIESAWAIMKLTDVKLIRTTLTGEFDGQGNYVRGGSIEVIEKDVPIQMTLVGVLPDASGTGLEGWPLWTKSINAATANSDRSVAMNMTQFCQAYLQARRHWDFFDFVFQPASVQNDFGEIAGDVEEGMVALRDATLDIQATWIDGYDNRFVGTITAERLEWGEASFGDIHIEFRTNAGWAMPDNVRAPYRMPPPQV